MISALFFFGLLGALFGSFSGVLAERLHTGERLTSDRSRCNACGRTLSALDLLPVISWLSTFGRCRTCGAKVPFRYALVELVLGLLFIAAFLSLGFSIALLVFLFCLVILMALTLYDLAHTIVPEELAILLLISTTVFAVLTAGSAAALGLHLLVAGIIGLLFFLLHVLSGGRAMGLGDAPIALALALLAGRTAISGLLFSFWIGAVVGIGILVLRHKGHRMNSEIPFVPFLAAGFLLAYFTGWDPLSIAFL